MLSKFTRPDVFGPRRVAEVAVIWSGLTMTLRLCCGLLDDFAVVADGGAGSRFLSATSSRCCRSAREVLPVALRGFVGFRAY